MSAKRAAHVLSSTISLCINTLSPEAAATATFCENMDNIFDSVNSSSLSHKSKKYRRVLSWDTKEDHANFR